MDPQARDTAATAAGGGAAWMLLQTVRWDQIGHGPGELLKLAVCGVMALAGWLIYRAPRPSA